MAWIAENDDAGTLDADIIAGYVSTLLLADLFHKEPAVVAQDIVRVRNARAS